MSASSAADLVRTLYTAIDDRDFEAGFSLLSEDYGGKIVRLEVFPAREDARKAARLGSA